MLDIKKIRENYKEIEVKLRSKNPEIDIKKIFEIDKELRELKTKAEKLKAKRNKASKEISTVSDKKNLLKEMSLIKEEIISLDSKIKFLEEELKTGLSYLPNIPENDIRISLDPKDNVLIKEVGEKKDFSFPIKNHVELNQKLHLFDFERAAKITGAFWPLYTNLGAKLEWALLNYMLSIHFEKGYQYILPPILTKQQIMYGAGQLPKFESQLFKINDEDYNLYLIPTAEVPICGLHADEILPIENLPLKYVSYTPCFRREAGASGKQERGLIRMHQFNKVELFCITNPKDSKKMQEEMILSAEEVLKGLNLHFRNMLLVTGDMSFPSARTVDIEVWLPGQNRYYEVSSVSNCTDFQARRSKIRFKDKNEKPELVHTLNGSGVATSRLMVALLENNQQSDGSVKIPKVLQDFMQTDILKPVSQNSHH